jgi:hypothetical protein
MDFQTFVQQDVLDAGRGALHSPQGSLSLVGKFLPALLATEDVRLEMLRLLQPVNRLLIPDNFLRLLTHRVEGDKHQAWVFMQQHLPSPRHFRDFDAQVWVAGHLRFSPRRLGGQPFDSFDCVCQVRDVPDVLDPIFRLPPASAQRGGWDFQGIPLTRPVSLHDWMHSQGLDPTLVPEMPDEVVQLVQRDWDCPVRGRRMLEKGTICGASGYLFQVAWEATVEPSVVVGIQTLIREALGEQSDPRWENIALRHQQLLEQDSRRLVFTYHPSDETISCNGEHLLRGVPAKILQKVLMAHTITGRTLFEHREFRRDPDLNLDPVNPNLESRLRILTERLEERVVGLRLIKSQRGRFSIEADFPLEYSES